MGRSGQGHVVIIGTGLAGVLAAAAVAPAAERVSLLDRYEVPDGPQPRRGVPQARGGPLPALRRCLRAVCGGVPANGRSGDPLDC